MLKRNFVAVIAVWALAALLAWTGPAWAQGGFGLGDGSEPKIRVSGQFTAAEGDQPARLYVSAAMEPGWYIYSITQEEGGPIRTKLKVADGQGVELLEVYQVHPAPKVAADDIFPDVAQIEKHYDSVVWHVPIRIDEGVDVSKLKISGTVYAQACTDTACLAPEEYAFTAVLGPGAKVPAEQLEVAVVAEPPLPTPPESTDPVPPSPFPDLPEPHGPPTIATDEGAGAPEPRAEFYQDGSTWQAFTNLDDFSAVVGTKGVKFDPVQVSAHIERSRRNKTLLWTLALAFLGGLILNLMPCVLPVIGLKVMSFVTQAGESRGRAFMLNLVYAVGIIVVFMALAGLAVGMGVGWGSLFSYGVFNVAMAAVVFAMGLSFLGVWEIPIPGFVGSGKAAEIQQQEGLSAAFVKGMITTILATPCTGPFMGSAVAWAFFQPPQVVFAVFFAVGLGMASPYLVIGVFPEWIRFLPKPGAWMDTFKQVMGFLLLGTVVYILSFTDWPYIVPTVGLLFALWAGLWWFNRTPMTAPASEKWRAWMEATAFVGVAWLLLFPGILGLSGLYGVMSERFAARVGDRTHEAAAVPLEPRIVVVDFTADWCPTCHVLEDTVLASEQVEAAFEKDQVVLLKADYTRKPPEIEKFLHILLTDQVPVLAVFSPDDPNRPIVFLDGYTKGAVLKALNASRPKS